MIPELSAWFLFRRMNRIVISELSSARVHITFTDPKSYKLSSTEELRQLTETQESLFDKEGSIRLYFRERDRDRKFYS